MLHNSSRSKVFQQIQDKDEAYIQYDIHIIQKYTSKDEICCEFREGVKQHIKTLAQNRHYKYQSYLKFNPHLVKSPFIELPHPLSNKITKLVGGGSAKSNSFTIDVPSSNAFYFSFKILFAFKLIWMVI